MTSYFSIRASFSFSVSMTLPLSSIPLSSLDTTANNDSVCTGEQLGAWFQVSSAGLLPSFIEMKKRQSGLFEHQPCPRFRMVSYQLDMCVSQHDGMIKFSYNATFVFTIRNFLWVNSDQTLNNQQTKMHAFWFNINLYVFYVKVRWKAAIFLKMTTMVKLLQHRIILTSQNHCKTNL